MINNEMPTMYKKHRAILLNPKGQCFLTTQQTQNKPVTPLPTLPKNSKETCHFKTIFNLHPIYRVP